MKIPVGSFRGPASGREGDHFLYGFKGVPAARQRRDSARRDADGHELARVGNVN